MTERPAERTAARPIADRGSEDTAVRPLPQRIRSRLAEAAQEHERNATVERPASGRAPRRARLRLTRVDPWSVMKTAFLLSIAIGVVTVVSMFIVWSVLEAAGVWEAINSTVRDIVGGDNAQTFDVENYVGLSRVLGFTMVIAVIDVVLLTAVATLGAFLYNMAAALLGGIEVTLSEE